MSEQESNDPRHRDLRIAALLAVTGIMVFFGVYWTLQIQDVIDLMEMAYGPDWWSS